MIGFSNHIHKRLIRLILVINNTRVIQGRLFGKKETGGKVEVLLLDYPGDNQKEKIVCRCLVKASKPLRRGSTIHFHEGVQALVLEGGSGLYHMAFDFKGDFYSVLKSIGHVPLPPYIKRNGRMSPPFDDRQASHVVFFNQFVGEMRRYHLPLLVKGRVVERFSLCPW